MGVRVLYLRETQPSDLLPQGKSLTDIHSCCAVNQHDARTRSHHHYTRAPSQWQRGRDPAAGLPPRRGNAQAAYSELWAPQEPDIKVALWNKFHSPAPEEQMHSLALVNTLVSSNMYVMLGGGGTIQAFYSFDYKRNQLGTCKRRKYSKEKDGEREVPNIVTMVGSPNKWKCVL